MKPLRPWSGATVVLFLVCGIPRLLCAQAPCPSPPSAMGAAKGNIFTDAQEMDLGDAVAEQFEHNFRIVQDDELNSYLNEMGQRLLAQMPPTNMKFRFVLVDIPVPNAFTMPGGRIYVTRKLVAFMQNEDELAGVLGHELGHALTHQPAAEFSRVFREALGVKEVGDRADVFQKYNELIDNIGRKRLHFDPEENEEEQLVADKYGLYAMARAGYSPAVVPGVLNRLTETHGKTGNWLTDLFGGTTPNEQRLRDIKKYVAQMATSCVAPHRGASAENFGIWQARVIAYSATETQESLPGLLWTRQLSPPLESEINWVKFSPDGKYLLAQDDFNVYVLTRQPFRYVFRIPVENAEPARFTPDSQSVLIWTHGLHIEKWRLARQTRTQVHEVVVQTPCLQSELSPNGNIVACVRMQPLGETVDELKFDMELLDVTSSAPLIRKISFYQVGAFGWGIFFMLNAVLTEGHSELFHMDFSPDAQYFAISRDTTVLAWNLKDRSTVSVAGSVKSLMSGGFVFIGPDKVVGVDAHDPKKSGAARFPNGPIDLRVPMQGVRLFTPSCGDVAIVRPAGEYAVGVIDLKTGKGVVGSKMAALDVCDGTYARADPDGSIGLYGLATRQAVAKTDVSGHMIGWLGTAEVSPDMKWLAGSGGSQGGIWNLETGTRVLHVRGFGGCHFSPEDIFYTVFPTYLKQKRTLGVLDPLHNQARSGQELGDEQAWESGPDLIYMKREKGKWNGPVDLEAHDVVTGKILWTKHFSQEGPAVSMFPWGSEMALVSSLASDEAKEHIKSDEQLAEQTKPIQSKDMSNFVEVIDARTGLVEGEFGVDTGKGSFQVRSALPAGKWVVVSDNENRVLIYTLDGKLVGRIFGARPVADNSTGTLAVESDDRTLEIYRLDTLEKERELKFSMPLAFYQIVDHGSELFALSADQTAYLLSLQQSKSN